MKVEAELDFVCGKDPNTGKKDYFDNPSSCTKAQARKSIETFMKQWEKGQQELYEKQNLEVKIKWKIKD